MWGATAQLGMSNPPWFWAGFPWPNPIMRRSITPWWTAISAKTSCKLCNKMIASWGCALHGFEWYSPGNEKRVDWKPRNWWSTRHNLLYQTWPAGNPHMKAEIFPARSLQFCRSLPIATTMNIHKPSIAIISQFIHIIHYPMIFHLPSTSIYLSLRQ